jgi:hypothetical protein
MSCLKNLFPQSVKEQFCLKNVTDTTVYFYVQGWTSFSKHLQDTIIVDQLSEPIFT